MKFKEKIRKNYPGLVDLSHKLRGFLAYHIYGKSPKKLIVIGVTGTNGKTTTAHMIASILEASGEKVGMATTTTFKVGSKIQTNSTNMTTISPFALQSLMRKMVKAGCKYAVIETTSHAIAQYRNWGIRYYCSVMTNVTHDHLDYHKTFEKYLSTKLKLFRKSRFAIVNRDDPSWERFAKASTGQVLTYAIDERSDIAARKILQDPTGTIFTIVLPSGQVTVNLLLPGKFNISNALAAASACFALNVSNEAIKEGLENLKQVPGRMEKVSSGQDFNVIVDYAHTPDALEKVYSALRQALKGKMIVVLGACGDRDKTKRPVMGAIAGEYADTVIVTDEEPYTEDPLEIIQQVASGVPSGSKIKQRIENKNFFIINDRREAIARALSLADRNDTVVITGMGAQEYRVVGSEHQPWNERKIILQELGKLGYNKVNK